HEQQPGLGASGVVAAEGVERARRLPRRVGGERVEPGFEPAVDVGGVGRDGRGVSPIGGNGVRGAGGTAHDASTATRPRWCGAAGGGGGAAGKGWSRSSSRRYMGVESGGTGGDCRRSGVTGFVARAERLISRAPRSGPGGGWPRPRRPAAAAPAGTAVTRA